MSECLMDGNNIIIGSFSRGRRQSIQLCSLSPTVPGRALSIRGLNSDVIIRIWCYLNTRQNTNNVAQIQCLDKQKLGTKEKQVDHTSGTRSMILWDIRAAELCHIVLT